MDCLGKVKIINTYYTIYLHKDYKALNKFAVEWEKEYTYNEIENKKNEITGFCLVAVKEIHIFTGFSEDYMYNTIRHELWHALLYEIGYNHWDDEDLIEKLAIWTPLMENILKQGKELIKNARVKEKSSSKEDSIGCISNSK